MAVFKVWWPENGQSQDDARTIKALDYEEAAENWAGWYDHHSADYAIVGGEVAVVMVLKEGESSPISVQVFGEMTRSYSAGRLKGDAK